MQTMQTTNPITTNDSLIALQARMPAGIKVVIGKHNVHYVVRSSKNGKKVSLGTFTDLDEAIQALINFKFLNKTMQDKEIDKNTLLSWEDAKSYMDTIGIHNLESGKAYTYVTESGECIKIPANFVTNYINDIYYGYKASDL